MSFHTSDCVPVINDPKKLSKVMKGLLYSVVYSNDVHFNPLFDLCLSGNAASTPRFPSRHLHSHLWPLNSVTAVWGSCFIPWLSGEIQKNGYFIWLLPCKKSLKLRYRFDFSKKSFYMYIILHEGMSRIIFLQCGCSHYYAILWLCKRIHCVKIGLHFCIIQSAFFVW